MKANPLFQGKSKIDNEDQSPEDDDTIFVQRRENKTNQEGGKENLSKTLSKAPDNTEINSSSTYNPEGTTFVESFRHSKW